MNVAKLHRKFIDLYNEYEKVVAYEFFLHYFKKSYISFGFPRSDICGECELFNLKTKSSESDFEIIILKKKSIKQNQISFIKFKMKLKVW
jgi:hypothetical protein